jgi:hypothetical protein
MVQASALFLKSHAQILRGMRGYFASCLVPQVVEVNPDPNGQGFRVHGSMVVVDQDTGQDLDPTGAKAAAARAAAGGGGDKNGPGGAFWCVCVCVVGGGGAFLGGLSLGFRKGWRGFLLPNSTCQHVLIAPIS